jgi:hypothetical protein
MVIRFDRSAVNKAEKTPEGFLKADSIVTRTGVFNYIEADGSIRRELRHPDDVFSFDSLESMKMRPITNGHPPQKMVNAKNAKELTVGYTSEKVLADGEFLITTLLVTDEKAIRDVESGKKQELSLGYTVDLVPEKGVYNGIEYNSRQTNIRYNHLALVEKARAGPSARIHLDGDDAITFYENNEIDNNINKKMDSEMSDNFKTITLDGLEYKAAPEVINAFAKKNQELSDKSSKLDSLNIEFEKLKAEKDSLKEKLDEAAKFDMAGEINKAVKERVKLISDIKNLFNNDTEGFNFDGMSDLELKKLAVEKKCKKANLDGVSEVYIQARFDGILEDFSEKGNSKIGEQRKLATRKLDAEKEEDEEKEELDEEKARERMMAKMKDGYKKDRKK